MPGKPHTIEYLEVAVKKDIAALPKSAKDVIKKAIENCLPLGSIRFGKPLRHTLKGYRRLRVGHYRVVYRIIQSQSTVVVTAIQLRHDVYKQLLP